MVLRISMIPSVTYSGTSSYKLFVVHNVTSFLICLTKKEYTPVVYNLEVSKHFGQKIQEKLTKFTKILITFSCILLCAKMFGYSHCRYCLQEESTHFDIRVLTILLWRYRILLGLKKLYNKKSAKLIKISKLCQAFILHFLFQNVSMLPDHILPTRAKCIFTFSHQT